MTPNKTNNQSMEENSSTATEEITLKRWNEPIFLGKDESYFGAVEREIITLGKIPLNKRKPYIKTRKFEEIVAYSQQFQYNLRKYLFGSLLEVILETKNLADKV